MWVFPHLNLIGWMDNINLQVSSELMLMYKCLLLCWAAVQPGNLVETSNIFVKYVMANLIIFADVIHVHLIINNDGDDDPEPCRVHTEVTQVTTNILTLVSHHEWYNHDCLWWFESTYTLIWLLIRIRIVFTLCTFVVRSTLLNQGRV